MKEQKLYVCDYCGTQYKEKAECKKCEEGHKLPVEIKDSKYTSIKCKWLSYANSYKI